MATLLEPQHFPQSTAQSLIEHYTPLVQRLVNGIKRRHKDSIDEIDLLNAGLMGLVDAINRYNPNLGDSFSAYARIRVRGALLDRVRQEDNLSRSRRSFAKRFGVAKQELEMTLQRSPTHSEIAKQMGLSFERFEHLLAEVSERSIPLSELDKRQTIQIAGGKVSSVIDLGEGDPLAKLLSAENSIIIETALELLSPKQRLCIKLSFYEDLPLTRIAELLEVSVSRVSQVRTEALQVLKKHLQQLQ